MKSRRFKNSVGVKMPGSTSSSSKRCSSSTHHITIAFRNSPCTSRTFQTRPQPSIRNQCLALERSPSHYSTTTSEPPSHVHQLFADSCFLNNSKPTAGSTEGALTNRQVHFVLTTSSFITDDQVVTLEELFLRSVQVQVDCQGRPA